VDVFRPLLSPSTIQRDELFYPRYYHGKSEVCHLDSIIFQPYQSFLPPSLLIRSVSFSRERFSHPGHRKFDTHVVILVPKILFCKRCSDTPLLPSLLMIALDHHSQQEKFLCFHFVFLFNCLFGSSCLCNMLGIKQTL
jgi:hypothetical protein